jgi:hypothetical protein
MVSANLGAHKAVSLAKSVRHRHRSRLPIHQAIGLLPNDPNLWGHSFDVDCQNRQREKGVTLPWSDSPIDTDANKREGAFSIGLAFQAWALDFGFVDC